MDEYKITHSKFVDNDLQNIRQHVLDISQSELSARRTINRIMKSISSLKFVPERGRYIGTNEYGCPVRSISAGKSYSIVFSVDNTNMCVDIKRISYARRNITMHDIKD